MRVAAVIAAAILAGCSASGEAGRQDDKSRLVQIERMVRLECLDEAGRLLHEDMRQVLEVFDDHSRRVYLERGTGELLLGRPDDHLTCRLIPLEPMASGT